MSRHMRTTVRLNDELLRQAKKAAAESHRTLTALVEDGLRLVLSERAMEIPRKRFRVKAFRGAGGLQPGVDVTSWRSLLGAMEGRRAAR